MDDTVLLRGKSATELLEEGHEFFTVGTLRQHEKRLGELLADGANHGDALSPVLVKYDLDWLARVHPDRLHLHPHVEGGLVGVDDQGLLADKLGQGDGKFLNFLLRLVGGLLVLVIGDVVPNLVFPVEFPQ